MTSSANTSGNISSKEFFDLYFAYTEHTESSKIYHRWCALSAAATMLGRGSYMQFGFQNLYPNLYLMLIGKAGDRKTGAIKIARGLVGKASTIAMSANKTSKEKFLFDLAMLAKQSDSLGISEIDLDLWGTPGYGVNDPAEMYIAADEFNNFIGNGNMDFVSLLGELWDYDDVYTYKVKADADSYIPYPTINILGGNTPTGFALAFPSEAMEQGFFSRLLLIHAKPTGKKLTIPPKPDPHIEAELVKVLQHFRAKPVGEILCDQSSSAYRLLDKIYKTTEPLADVRFDAYSNRRFTHLLKIVLIFAAMRGAKVVSEEDVRQASTILLCAETRMPTALGEFGKGRNSDVVFKIMAILDRAHLPVAPKQLFEELLQDVNSIQDLVGILRDLLTAGKIQQVDTGYLPKRKVLLMKDSDIFDSSFLCQSELLG